LKSSRIINCGQAIREGLIESAVKDSSVIFLAEGVDDPSAVYGTLSGLNEYISANRIIEMPLSENALTGVAVGAAMMGKRPVLSFHRVEFALLAMEQIANNAAKAHYISCGRHNVPLIMRLIVGRGWGQGPEHSQSMEAMFAMIPGLKVLMPTFPADAKGMIISAIEDNNPVIIIEHRWCHYAQGEVPLGYYRSPLDGPKKIREGKDITIVASSFMTLEAVQASEELAELGYSATVFDLRVIRPLQLEEVFKSVSETGRLITIDTGFKKFGIGSEIVSEVVTNCFGKLKSAPVRIGMPEHPSPSSRGYLSGLYPDAARIVKEAASLLGIPGDKIEKSLKNIQEKRGDLSIDVPDPRFKGPF
jgi:pyruvate/2-oxoglutarate/acetoin dehydrogenase E1 component